MKFGIYRCLAVFLPVFVFLSCGKDKPLTGAASLTIVDAFPGDRYLIPVFNRADMLSAKDGSYGVFYNDSTAANQFSAYSGKVPLSIFYPTDTATKSVPVFELTLDLSLASIHTLFLTGIREKPDTLLTTDNPPYHPLSDSSVGIRFVNLSPGSAPMTVNLQGKATGSEVASLSFRGLTAFKNYPANAGAGDYVFEFRDLATGVLLGTSAMYNVGGILDQNRWRFRNYTIVIDGLPGVHSGPYAQAVFRTNNF